MTFNNDFSEEKDLREYKEFLEECLEEILLDNESFYIERPEPGELLFLIKIIKDEGLKSSSTQIIAPHPELVPYGVEKEFYKKVLNERLSSIGFRKTKG